MQWNALKELLGEANRSIEKSNHEGGFKAGISVKWMDLDVVRVRHWAKAME